jgi:hypothetical protein
LVLLGQEFRQIKVEIPQMQYSVGFIE